MAMSIKRSFWKYDLVARKINFLIIFSRPTLRNKHVCLLCPSMPLFSYKHDSYFILFFYKMAGTGRSWVKILASWRGATLQRVVYEQCGHAPCPSGLSRFDYATHMSLYYGIGGTLRTPESSCFPSQSIHFLWIWAGLKIGTPRQVFLRSPDGILLVTKDIMTNKLRKHTFIFLSSYLFWSILVNLFLL